MSLKNVSQLRCRLSPLRSPTLGRYISFPGGEILKMRAGRSLEKKMKITDYLAAKLRCPARVSRAKM